MQFEYYVLNYDCNKKKVENFNIFRNCLVQEHTEKAVRKYLRNPKNYKYVVQHKNDFLGREEWYEEYLIDELIDFFSFEIMNMCGCGCPEYTYDMIRIVLNIREDRFEKDIKYEEVQKRYKEELHLDTKDSLHYGVLQFVLYMLDAKGIVEHGGGISSCWLTKLGRMYLTVLNAWHDREEKEKKEVGDLD